MHDSAVPTSRLITVCLWSVTGTLFAGAVMMALLGDDHHANLIAHAACIFSTMAAVSHVRCLMLKAVRTVKAEVRRNGEDVGGARALQSV